MEKIGSHLNTNSVQIETEKLLSMIKFKHEEGSKENTKSFIEYLKKLKEAKLGVSNSIRSSNRFSILETVSELFNPLLNFPFLLFSLKTSRGSRTPMRRRTRISTSLHC